MKNCKNMDKNLFFASEDDELLCNALQKIESEMSDVEMCSDDDKFLCEVLDKIEEGIQGENLSMDLDKNDEYDFDKFLCEIDDKLENVDESVIEKILLDLDNSELVNIIGFDAEELENENDTMMEIDQLPLDANNEFEQMLPDEINETVQMSPDVINEIDQEGSGIGPKLFQLSGEKEWFYKKFNMTGKCYSLEINKQSLKKEADAETWLRKLLMAVITYFKNSSKIKVNPGDRVGMSFRNNSFDENPIYIGLIRFDQLGPDVVFDHIIKVFGSNKEFFLNGYLEVNFDHIQMPHGAGRIARSFGQSNADFILKKASFMKYTIPKGKKYKKYLNDGYCLPYAIVIARAYDEFSRLPKKSRKKTHYTKFQRGFKSLREKAEELCRLAGVVIPKEGRTFDEVKQFQAILPEYQLVVYRPDSKSPKHFDSSYSGKRRLCFMLHDNHYLAVRTVQGSFGARYLCPDCHSHTATKSKHVCKYTCAQCFSKPKCSTRTPLYSCLVCHRSFYGAKCFANHKQSLLGSESVCDSRQNCSKCFAPKYKDHECGKKMCYTCEKIVDKIDHLCHMPGYKTKRNADTNFLNIYFDLETQQNTILGTDESKFKHVPNLCVSNAICSECDPDLDISQPCDFCGDDREMIFQRENCIEQLMDYIVEKHEDTKIRKTEDGKDREVAKYEYITVIAHSLKGFDGQFILKYIYESDRFPNPGLIMNGTKVIQISIGTRVRFIDSLNFFQVGLSKLPELCGIEDSKGCYPHFFNTPENRNYIGKIPEKHFYGYNEMTEKARKKFDGWYDKLPIDFVFDNKKELIEYCRKDVEILRKACEIFRSTFFKENGIEPFIDGPCTIAGACAKVFRSKYLKEDTIGLIPPKGYRLSENQSRAALKWLYKLEMEGNIEIQHVGRGKEFSHPSFGRVDGYHASTKTILEFDGCYYHGCPCTPAHFGETGTNTFEMYSKRRDDTLAKHRKIQDAGFKLTVMRECDFTKEMKRNPALNELLETMVSGDSPLDPRDAFYGGRTNANILYYKSDGKSKMHYYDINSLYPYINLTSPCVVSHPKLHVGRDCMKVPWQNMHGLMKVTVLPPRRLRFPVLPFRLHKKLLFFLCHTCAKDLAKKRCRHKPDERMFTGTWVIDEVKLAVSKGYEVVNIHEIWEYEVTKYDPETRTGGFFSGFINNFLKIKIEASGWPNWCNSDEKKKSYIQSVFEREGIQLEESKIVFNPSLRSMAKIMLNSFWGRFGMRPDLVRTQLISDGQVLVDKIMDPQLEIQSVVPINEECMLLNYREKEDAREINKTTNVVIASMTTAFARMELYKYLELVGPHRVFYFDTDSLLFVSRDGDTMPPLGDFLGQMKDEIVDEYGPGAYIIEYVSGGPKNYAIKIFIPSTGETVTKVKVKGISLNFETSKLINFDTMKKMILNGIKKNNNVDPLRKMKKLNKKKLIKKKLNKKNSNKIEVYNKNSIRRSSTGDVYTTCTKKTYQFNYSKRQLSKKSVYTTLPYGF